MNFIKKYKKDLLIVLLAFTLGLFAVSGDGFADLAKTKFWSSFWSVACVIGWVGALAGWIYLSVKDRAATKAEYQDLKNQGKV